MSDHFGGLEPKKKPNVSESNAERIVMRHSVEDFAKYMVNYWQTYMAQFDAENYEMTTVLNDALYGIGAGMNSDYRFATGFTEFKKGLLKHLTKLDVCHKCNGNGDLGAPLEVKCDACKGKGKSKLTNA